MKLEEIRRLIEAATPGPWNSWDDFIKLEGTTIEVRPEDGAFIAAARDLLPKLLKVAEAAEKIGHSNDCPAFDTHECWCGFEDLRGALDSLES